MSALVFDIETVGLPLEQFDNLTQEKIVGPQLEQESDLEFMDRQQKASEGLSFSPMTGQIVTIACIDSETGKGGSYFQAPDQSIDFTTKEGHRYLAQSEKGILEQFWNLASHYSEFVTFNGRGFDAPFIMLRSAIHRIKPPKNLIAARYLYQMNKSAVHVDLYEQLTFYRAYSGKYIGLHMACQAFGITSPKEGGMDGIQVGQAYKDGRYQEIAEYCLADVIATAELYQRWSKFLRFE